MTVSVWRLREENRKEASPPQGQRAWGLLARFDWFYFQLSFVSHLPTTPCPHVLLLSIPRQQETAVEFKYQNLELVFKIVLLWIKWIKGGQVHYQGPHPALNFELSNAGKPQDHTDLCSRTYNLPGTVVKKLLVVSWVGTYHFPLGAAFPRSPYEEHVS